MNTTKTPSQPAGPAQRDEERGGKQRGAHRRAQARAACRMHRTAGVLYQEPSARGFAGHGELPKSADRTHPRANITLWANAQTRQTSAAGARRASVTITILERRNTRNR